MQTKTGDRAPPRKRLRAQGAAVRLITAYLLFSGLWIVFSDKLVGHFFDTPQEIIEVSIVKGWSFILVSSLLFYFIGRHLFRLIEAHTASEQAALTQEKQAQALLAGVLNSSSDSIFAKGSDGRYLLFNSAAARIADLDAALVIGRSDAEIYPPAQAEAFCSVDRQVLGTGRRVVCEEVLTTPQGEFFYQTTKDPLLDKEGKIVGVLGVARDITDLKRSEDSLRRSEAESRRWFQDNTSVMLLIDPLNGRIIEANKAAVRFYGYPRGTLAGMRIGKISRLPEEQIMALNRKAARGESKLFYLTQRLASDVWRDVEVHTTPIQREGHTLLLSIIHDVTQRKQAEKSLRESEERLRLAMQASNQGWFDLDLITGAVRASPEYARILGYAPEEFSSDQSTWLANLHPEDYDMAAAALQDCIRDTHAYSIEYRRLTKDGRWRWIRSTGKTVAWDEEGQAIRLIGVHTDITERKEMEDQIRQLAFFDPLTGLPNRRLLDDRINRAMAASKRNQRWCALLFSDLDNFKPLNDRHGHKVGDLLLADVAERLRHCVREMDTVARFGGDEFVILIGDLSTSREEATALAMTIAEKIRASLAMPYVLAVADAGDGETIEHHCSASIGIALFLGQDGSAADILRDADNVMYEAKNAGGNCIRPVDRGRSTATRLPPSPA